MQSYIRMLCIYTRYHQIPIFLLLIGGLFILLLTFVEALLTNTSPTATAKFSALLSKYSAADSGI